MNRAFCFSMTFVAFVLGVMLAFQFRATSAEDNLLPRNREQEFALEKKQLVQDLLQLQEEVADLTAKLDKAGTGQNEANEAVERELVKIKRYAGLIPMSGPGVELSIQSPPGHAGASSAHGLKDIKDEHLLKVVNDLYSAGAEAIAVNGQRITAISEIRLAGSHINVNATPLSPPYRVVAIGNGAALKSRLEIKEGLVEYLSESGISVKVQVRDNVVIPAFNGAVNFEYARPVQKD